MKKQSRKTALIKHLIKGGKLSIKNAYLDFGISNISREVIRLIEVPFDVVLTRTKMNGKTKYGSVCTWYEYSASKRVINKLKKLKLLV